jgi:hypothetical protein
MNSAGKAAVLILLTALVAGCTHKAKTAPPQAAQAPTLPVSTLTKNAPPPQLPPANLPKITPPGPENTASNNPPPKSHKPNHRTKHPVETTGTEPASTKDQTTATATPQAPAQPQPSTAAPSQQASTGAATDVSPIGQLSAAGDSSNTPGRQDVLDEINSTETGLNNIKRTLSKEEQVTATQIRTFLAKAKDALKQEDLDAAHTLVTRARILLDELTKE